MTIRARLAYVTVVLNKPRFPENIGAAARAVCNMGIGQLVVVKPQNFDEKRILALATHAAATVAENIRLFDNLPTALAGYRYVVGTTARLGGERHTVTSPHQMAQQLIAITRQNKVALLFGPEDRGLTNEELRLCHLLVNIPTSDFSSLNLAQAVMVICYELFKATLDPAKPFTPRLASRHELDGMYDQVKEILVRINYIQPNNPDYWMNKLRHFFSRLQLRAGEVSIIRGICRQIDWYAGKCYRDGVRATAAAPHTDKIEKPVE
jgi:tRNA/rRNA methyltransferase